ncbi:MAG: T9SS type A sorting domain-containing protein [Bacteroidetes bacterium]|jgi:hypothetical protein|nr:T9SS type A sorting domain-containing protein [Bacteroidota bacterium]
MKILQKILLVSLLTLIPFFTANSQQAPDNRINIDGQNVFLSGSNIAWINYGRDVGPNSVELSRFDEIFQTVQVKGGNALRLWIHINGTNTPEWSGDEVSGPGSGTIEDIKAILDAAWEKNISFVLCLWSFDMLQGAGTQTGLSSDQIEKNRALLENPDKLQAYINNALIPMVEALGDHPAIAAWEVFNEPEGMSNEFNGWTPNKVNMADIQMMVNRVAGAIHRTNESAIVSNGAWSFHSLANTSHQNSKNYYSDAELIAAGGDEEGTLDFYMVHYYPWGGTEISPFHHDKDFWGLDKPVVVAEFDAVDTFGVPGDETYETLYNRGYAGALGWEYSPDGGDFFESWQNIKINMEYMFENFAEDVALGKVNPTILRLRSVPDQIAEGDSSLIQWKAIFSDQLTMNGQLVNSEDSMYVNPAQTTTYEFIAIGADPVAADTASVTVEVVAPGELNRALGKKAISSANEQGLGNEDPGAVTDGDPGTRWSSPYQDDHWIFIDLEKVFSINSVTLNWEVAYGESYDIQVSVDAQNWTTVHEERNGDGGVDEITLNQPEKGRYIRMKGIKRGTEFGYSLWEFEVRGLLAENQPPAITLNEPRDGISMRPGSSLFLQANVEESDNEPTAVSFYLNDELRGTVSEAPYELIFKNIEEGDYSVYATADDGNFTVQSAAAVVNVDPAMSSRRLEAEDAYATGTIEQTTGSTVLVSGGGLAIIEDSGSLIWHNVGMGNEETYTLKLRYNLPHGEKFQKLSINGAVTDTLYFEEVGSGWMSKDTTITYSEPIYTISIDHFWGYLNIDYIQLTVEQAVSNEEQADIPIQTELHQNYPNPFNPATNISYTLSKSGSTNLTVYDLAGRKVAELVNGVQSSGNHTVSWDATSMASGLYIYRLQTNGSSISKKMLLIK